MTIWSLVSKANISVDILHIHYGVITSDAQEKPVRLSKHPMTSNNMHIGTCLE